MLSTRRIIFNFYLFCKDNMDRLNKYTDLVPLEYSINTIECGDVKLIEVTNRYFSALIKPELQKEEIYLNLIDFDDITIDNHDLKQYTRELEYLIPKQIFKDMFRYKECNKYFVKKENNKDIFLNTINQFHSSEKMHTSWHCKIGLMQLEPSDYISKIFEKIKINNNLTFFEELYNHSKDILDI